MLDLDIPNVSGSRGKLGSIGKKHMKRIGNKRVRAAVRQSLRLQDDRDAKRVHSITAWDLD